MLLKFAVPEAKPMTNLAPGPAIAQDAAETFNVLGGTDLLRAQNHAPHEQQHFNDDMEFSEAVTKLLMIANTATLRHVIARPRPAPPSHEPLCMSLK